MFLCLSVLNSNICLAAENFTGLFVETKKINYIQFLNSGEILPLADSDAPVAPTLKKLNNGDLIIGNGQRVDLKFKILAVDYVGLIDVIGKWSADGALFDFQSFFDLQITLNPYYFRSQLLADFFDFPLESQTYTRSMMLKYTLSPSDRTEWVLLLSNSSETHFATLKLQADQAWLTLYNSENGKAEQTIKLTRFH